MKAVSVIIPNYNNARYLKDAIQSVLAQTFTDYEIIVVDDGSTDNSKAVVEAFGDKVRYIWQQNKGLGGARNTGILASETPFIGLLDADDEWKPTFLEKLILLAQSHPDAAVYFSAAQGMDSVGKDLPQVFGRAVSSEPLYQSLLRANFIIPSTVLLRRAAVLEAGLFEDKNRDLHGCEDWDLWLRLAPSHSFEGTGEVLVRYRQHTNTFSANPGHMQEAVRTVMEKNFGIDDGNHKSWSMAKTRAFGGVYRYQALTSVQKQGNWEVGAKFLARALEIDQTLSGDLDLFYELAFGDQPSGYKDSAHHLELEQNAKRIINILGHIFSEQPGSHAVSRKTFATANYAMGLVAYNINRRDLSRYFLFQALTLRPRLFFDQKLILTFVKSWIPPYLITRLKRV